MQKFVYAAIASLAAAESIPTMIESKIHEFMDHENTDYNVVITQISGQENFVMLPNDSYADPNPVQTASVEHFNVGGMWNVPNVDLHKVTFTCLLQGVEVYKQEYLCTDGDASCPLATTPGVEWKGLFDFDVPGFAPPFQYDVHVLAATTDGTSLFELESKFYIP